MFCSDYTHTWNFTDVWVDLSLRFFKYGNGKDKNKCWWGIVWFMSWSLFKCFIDLNLIWKIRGWKEEERVWVRYFQVYINIQRKSSKLSIEFENYLTLSRTVHISREVSGRIPFSLSPNLCHYPDHYSRRKETFLFSQKWNFHHLVLRYKECSLLMLICLFSKASWKQPFVTSLHKYFPKDIDIIKVPFSDMMSFATSYVLIKWFIIITLPSI